MSEKTKLSAGALRAATGCFNLPYGSAPTKSTADWTVEQMSRIIDRETGVAELLEAAKGFMRAPQPVAGEYSEEVKAHNLAWVRLEQAIAKAEAK